MSGDDEGRDHEPTERRLEEARRKGDLPRSADTNTAASYLGLLIALAGLGAAGVAAFAQSASAFLSAAADPVRRPGTVVALDAFRMAGAFWPALVLPAAAVLISLVVQRAVVVAPDKLALRLSRIDPLANARQKFGRGGLVEFAKALIKAAAVAAGLVMLAGGDGDRILAPQRLPAAAVGALAARVLTEVVLWSALVAGAIGAGDLLWQRFEFRRRNRMTRQELVEEFKQSEGDPHLRQARRQRAEAIATNRMLRDVARADVVIVNPTHYAVALRWSRASGRAPVCVAKGVDAMAAQIRLRAAEAGVPIRSDPPTARALHASVGLGEEIRTEHFAPVAAAIRFAEAMRRRSRERGR